MAATRPATRRDSTPGMRSSLPARESGSGGDFGDMVRFALVLDVAEPEMTMAPGGQRSRCCCFYIILKLMRLDGLFGGRLLPSGG